jgi:hypothetical protein
VVGDDSKVADSGSLTFPGFDGVARPYPRSSGPKDGFPGFIRNDVESNVATVSERFAIAVRFFSFGEDD